MSRYSGIVQSVEQWTVKMEDVSESPFKKIKKVAEICGFFIPKNRCFDFIMISHGNAQNMLKTAIYCPSIFIVSHYGTWKTLVHLAKNDAFLIPFFDEKFSIFKTLICRNRLPHFYCIKNPRKPRKSWLGQLDSNQ